MELRKLLQMRETTIRRVMEENNLLRARLDLIEGGDGESKTRHTPPSGSPRSRLRGVSPTPGDRSSPGGQKKSKRCNQGSSSRGVAHGGKRPAYSPVQSRAAPTLRHALDDPAAVSLSDAFRMHAPPAAGHQRSPPQLPRQRVRPLRTPPPVELPSPVPLRLAFAPGEATAERGVPPMPSLGRDALSMSVSSINRSVVSESDSGGGMSPSPAGRSIPNSAGS